MKRPALPTIPRPIRLALWVLVPASLVPFALVANSRANHSTKPRVQMFQGMANQPRLSPQGTSTRFDDGRAMRQPVPGTVARGHLDPADHYHLGYVPGVTVPDPETGKPMKKYYAGFPPEFDLTPAMMARGQRRFDIYCAPCHAASGDGHGMVSKRAIELETKTWVQPTNLHSAPVLVMPLGQIFDTITNGVRNMPSYSDQIPVEDRWAIVGYVKALQRSQNAPVEAIPADKRTK